MSNFNQTLKIRNQYILLILMINVQKWMDGVGPTNIGFLESSKISYK
jgi:hypothetical protein